MSCWQDGSRAGPSEELANSSVGCKLLSYRIKSLERLSKDWLQRGNGAEQSSKLSLSEGEMHTCRQESSLAPLILEGFGAMGALGI